MIWTNGPAKLEKEQRKPNFKKINLIVCIKSNKVDKLNAIIKYIQFKIVHTMKVTQL